MIERVTHRDSEKLDADTVVQEKLIGFKVTLSGSAPHAISFKTLGLPVMADALYRVFADGETAAQVHVDESTITEQGFDLLHGVAGEVVHFLVHGLQVAE